VGKPAEFTDPVVSDVAAICVALADGMAVQVLSDPEAIDVDRVLSAFKPALDSMVRATHLASSGASDPLRPPSPSVSVDPGQ
jgi:hypothetical protein